jgi:hypothetical protein
MTLYPEPNQTVIGYMSSHLEGEPVHSILAYRTGTDEYLPLNLPVQLMHSEPWNSQKRF